MHPKNIYDLITVSAEWLRNEGVNKIDFGLILGSGLGEVVNQFDALRSYDYTDVPHLAGTAVVSHVGVLHYVRVGSLFGLIFQGRIHYYEGYEMWQVAYPVRIVKALGGSLFITTGAAGGLNPAFDEGQIVLLRDHINLMPESPLRGPHDPRLGDRFPDMSEPYSVRLREMFLQTAGRQSINLPEGVYAGLPGPSLETRSEYAYLNGIGADLVAMSIIPEIIVANQARLESAGLCVVSNVCYPPDAVTLTTVEDVVRLMRASSIDVGKLLLEVIGRLAD